MPLPASVPPFCVPETIVGENAPMSNVPVKIVTAVDPEMALELPRRRRPPFTFVRPPYELLPERVIVPAPAFTNPPGPLMLPAYTVVAPRPPAVSVPLPTATFTPPASELNDSLPARVITAPAEPVTFGCTTSRPAEPSVSVPEATSTVPADDTPSSDVLAVTLTVPAPRLLATVPPPNA